MTLKEIFNEFDQKYNGGITEASYSDRRKKLMDRFETLGLNNNDLDCFKVHGVYEINEDSKDFIFFLLGSNSNEIFRLIKNNELRAKHYGRYIKIVECFIGFLRKNIENNDIFDLLIGKVLVSTRYSFYRRYCDKINKIENFLDYYKALMSDDFERYLAADFAYLSPCDKDILLDMLCTMFNLWVRVFNGLADVKDDRASLDFDELTANLDESELSRLSKELFVEIFNNEYNYREAEQEYDYTLIEEVVSQIKDGLTIEHRTHERYNKDTYGLEYFKILSSNLLFEETLTCLNFDFE